MVSGSFVGIDNHLYWVYFDGVGVPNAQVTLSNVVISMDAGDRKFVGFKTTSCKVSIVTDTHLTWAYTESSTGISVSVVDATDSEAIFTGYVVPFAFEQPVSGCADNVTIDCVDVLTANKEILYTSLEDGDRYGVDVRGIDIIRNMVNVAGRDKISQIVIHKNFDWQNLDEIVLDTMLAQAGFIQDEMTALEAMNAVCVFFGFTAHLVGDKLCLYDEYALVKAANGYDLNAVVEDVNGGYARTKYYQDSASPLQLVELSGDNIHTDVSLTVERAYDGVKVKPVGLNTSYICPDICDPTNVKENTDGRGTESKYPNIEADDTHLVNERRTPVESKVMYLGQSDSADGIRPWEYNNQITGGGSWVNGAMLLQVARKETLKSYMGFWYVKWSDPKILLWIRDVQGDGLHRMGLQYRGYSHTGGYIELRLSHKRSTNDWADLEPSGNYGDDTELKLFHIKVGDKYFLSDYSTDDPYDDYDAPNEGPRYGDSYAYKDSLDSSEKLKYWDGVVVIDRGNIMPTYTATSFEKNGYVVKINSSEQIKLEIGVDRKVLAGDPIYYESGIVISKLEILGFGEDINTDSYHYRREFVDSPREFLEVDTSLTTRASYQTTAEVIPLGVNARPGVVPAKNYSGGGYMGMVENQTINGCGILMEQLSNRYNKPHNRYTMTVEGNISPTSKISYKGAYYTVEGYERDIVSNTTTIIIN